MKKTLTHKEALEAYEDGRIVYYHAHGTTSNLRRAEPFRHLQLARMLQADELWIEVEEEKPVYDHDDLLKLIVRAVGEMEIESRGTPLSYRNPKIVKQGKETIIDSLIDALELCVDKAVSQAKKEVAKAYQDAVSAATAYESVRDFYIRVGKELEK